MEETLTSVRLHPGPFFCQNVLIVLWGSHSKMEDVIINLRVRLKVSLSLKLWSSYLITNIKFSWMKMMLFVL